jgi:mRNA export factor
MSYFAAPAATTTPSTTASADKDVEMGDPPTDSISSMAFSPQADYLSVGSWDNSVCSCNLTCLMTSSDVWQVRIYEIGAGGQSQGKAMYQHQGPVLSVCWNKVGSLWYAL